MKSAPSTTPHELPPSLSQGAVHLRTNLYSSGKSATLHKSTPKPLVERAGRRRPPVLVIERLDGTRLLSITQRQHKTEN